MSLSLTHAHAPASILKLHSTWILSKITIGLGKIWLIDVCSLYCCQYNFGATLNWRSCVNISSTGLFLFLNIIVIANYTWEFRAHRDGNLCLCTYNLKSYLLFFFYFFLIIYFLSIFLISVESSLLICLDQIMLLSCWIRNRNRGLKKRMKKMVDDSRW